MPTRRVLLTLIVGTALSAGAFLAAPTSWPEGPGAVVVTAEGTALVSVPIQLGDAEPVTVTDGPTAIELPSGAPVDGQITIEVVTHGTSPRGVAVELELPDGRRETVPVLDVVDGQTVVAQRTPPSGSAVVLVLLAAVVVLWVSEAVPLHVTSLVIPVVLAIAAVDTAQAVLAPFFDPIVVLFFAGFLMAQAMTHVGLDRLAADAVVRHGGGSPLRLFSVLLAGSAFASMWMSNTAAVAALLPVARRVTEPLESPRYARTVVLGIAYAATIGGVGSAIGTTANPLAISYLSELTGRQISFVEWFGFGLPLVIVLLPLMGAWLWWRGGGAIPTERFAAAKAAATDQAAIRLTGPQVRVLAVFGLVLAGWLTQTWHGISTGIVALAGAVVLMILGQIRTEDLGGISWSTLLTFGGALTLGLAIGTSGTSDWLVTRLGGVAGWSAGLSLAAVAAVALALTTVASNTAAAATLIPLAIPLAGLIGLDPVLLAVVVALASSIDFALVIGTPPTMLAYDTGMFTSAQILRTGAVLDLLGLAVLVGVIPPIWRLLGLV